MDQELKQRLIGAAVITALAAIFVPMLFDDPIDETGKTINEVKIPEMPAKVQDVEIMPLPEKSADVTTAQPAERPELPTAASVSGEEPALGEADLEAPKPKQHLTARDTAVSPRQARLVDEDLAAEAEDVPPPKALDSKLPAVKPAAVVANPLVQPSVKPVKPLVKPVEVIDEAARPAPVAAAPAAGSENSNTRWYLNAGSFSQKANAQTLLDTLKQQGFAATLKEVSSDKGLIYKVRVGPMLDRAKAQAVKARLAQININSFVSPEE